MEHLIDEGALTPRQTVLLARMVDLGNSHYNLFEAHEHELIVFMHLIHCVQEARHLIASIRTATSDDEECPLIAEEDELNMWDTKLTNRKYDILRNIRDNRVRLRDFNSLLESS